MQRDFDRDDQRRRYRQDDDPRDDPRERYGNEEDPRSREYRRAYAEHDLPRRMQDDRPYDRPGYEPESGRPGGRANVDPNRDRQQRTFDPRQSGDPYGYDWEQPAGQRERAGGSGRSDNRWQGGYYGQGQRFEGQPFGREGNWRQGDQRDRGQTPSSRRGEQYGQPAYGTSSPYDSGDIGSWYGGDTGMGDPGSSLPGAPSSQYGSPSGTQSRGQYGGASANQFRRQSGDQFDNNTRQSYGQGGQGGRSEGGRLPHGPFSGRGPRGYQRSDERIREDVCEMLTHHGDIDASSMDVDVSQATVILRGTADSGRVRRMVEELVEDIPGVRDVQNDLRVNQRTGHASTETQPPADWSRASDARTGSRDDSVPAYGVGVAGTSGVSTRSGPGEPGLSAGGGPSQHGNRWQIRETMDVIGSDGETVGTVKAVHGTDFHLDRPMHRDVFVPFSAVRTVDGERVMLSVRADAVSDQNWPAPDLTATHEGTKAR
jgi:hypothetical protein